MHRLVAVHLRIGFEFTEMYHLVVMHLRSLNLNNYSIAYYCQKVNSILQFCAKIEQFRVEIRKNPCHKPCFSRWLLRRFCTV